jgi:predicted nucleic acid-binding Zn ribbon protein
MPSKAVSRPCQRKDCEKQVRTTKSEISRGRGLYCGNQCAALARAETTQACAYVGCRKSFRVTRVQIQAGKKYCSDNCGARARLPQKRKFCACGAAVPPERRNTCSRECSAAMGVKTRAANGRYPKAPGRKAFGRPPVRDWAFAMDGAAARAERAKVWTETEERPRLNPLVPLGSMTKHGRVSAVGLRDGLRYYCLTDVATGAITQMPADVLEAGR